MSVPAEVAALFSINPSEFVLAELVAFRAGRPVDVIHLESTARPSPIEKWFAERDGEEEEA